MGNKTINKKIGARIQKLRKSKGFTQQKFSEAIGMSNNHLSEIERGHSFPKTDKLVAIARALDCSADDLFCDVIPRSQKAEEVRLSKLLAKMPPSEKEKTYALIEAVVDVPR